jgi:hypothetical protein
MASGDPMDRRGSRQQAGTTRPMDRLGETSREAEGSWSRRRSIRTVPWGSSFADRSGLHWAYWAASPVDQLTPSWHARPAAAARARRGLGAWDHEEEQQEDQGTRT